MADNNLDITINTKADKSEVEDLSEAIKKLNDESEIEIEVNGNDDELESTKKEIDDLESEVEVDVAVDDTEIIGASDSIDSLASAVDNASGSSDNLNQGLNIDSSPLSDASSMAYELSKGIGDADESTKELGNDLSLLEAGAMLDIANQLSQYGSAAEGLTQDMNEAAISVGQLATQTGIAEPQMISLINHISNATFPNNEAMMYVKSLDQIGVSSENLSKSATDLDKINDAFGLGATTVNSLGQELSVLGVDMNNVSSSFNALAYANANTVGGMENYYSFLKKYDAQFNELGFNVDQTSVIIAGATQKFGGGRAALSGLSDALKESNGDTRALEKALGLQAGAISNASELTGQYEGQLQELADEEAEHKSVLDRLGAVWEDLSLSMSPVLAPLTSFLGLIGQAGSFAVGINGLVTLAQSMKTLELANIANTVATKASAAAQWLLNIAMDANPIMIVVLAIIALIAILGYLYFNNEQVKQAINSLGQTFIFVGQIIYGAVLGFVNNVIIFLTNLWTYITNIGTMITSSVGITGNNVLNSIVGVMVFIATLPLQISSIFTNIIAKTLGFGDNFVQKMITSASNSVSGFMQYISSLPSKFYEELQKMLSYARDFLVNLPNILKNAAINVVKSWIFGTGEHSPGFMYDAFEGEIKEMINVPVTYSPKLNANVQRLGSSIVDSFGNPNLSFGIDFDGFNNLQLNNFNMPNTELLSRLFNSDENKQNSPIYITLNVGSVDKKERIDEIIDAVREYFLWNNTTAGRTV